MKKFSLIQQIGNTPIVELSKYSKNSKVRILAKLEGLNPSGSIKDRVAWQMIDGGQKRGLLDKNKTIIEATSGNTGIGMAMVSAIFGYRFVAVMPENASMERRKLLVACGASVVLTNAKGGTNESIKVAIMMVEKERDKYVMLNQYENFDNVLAHYLNTGKEIVKDIPYITHFVAGMGTGGTLMGVGKRLKEYNSNIKVVGVEPTMGSKIQGLRNMTLYTPPIFSKDKLDSVLVANDKDAFSLAKELIRKNGVSVGISSGAALWGAIELSKTIKSGTIVTIFPDKADRYVSTKLFD